MNRLIDRDLQVAWEKHIQPYYKGILEPRG